MVTMTTPTWSALAPEEEVFDRIESSCINLIANEDAYERAEFLKSIFADVEHLKAKMKELKEGKENFRSRMNRAETQVGKLETELKKLKGEI